jgi:hypothetical protein
MAKLWITLPAKDVRIQLPLGIFDGDVKILLMNEKVIDSAIEQLDEAKQAMSEEGGHILNV